MTRCPPSLRRSLSSLKSPARHTTAYRITCATIRQLGSDPSTHSNRNRKPSDLRSRRLTDSPASDLDETHLSNDNIRLRKSTVENTSDYSIPITVLSLPSRTTHLLSQTP
ncbi:hypothetical protein HanIR_Chr01g0020691 [Helianthus annuus]|nr:hypothetical protein HanIR_Chr01g0020691 [Helianthus annuus]